MPVRGKFLDTLRSRLSLSEIVGEKVKLTRKGREYHGLCPFHHEKTPSFTVNNEKEFYHCFGCGAHGDAIRFLTEIHKFTFMEAVKELAARAGLAIPTEMIGRDEEPKENLTPLLEALQEANLWYQRNLTQGKFIKALHYTESRGIRPETLQKFGLGYAPEGYHTLEEHLKEKGFPESVLLEAGLSAQGEEKKAPYDRFRGRLMFPIHNTKKQVVAFGGRLLDKGEPKYLNSPETSLFSKGKLLYGYGFAKEKAASDPLLIVEGYMDVISLYQAGYKGAVAPLGTALTEDQILLAWRLDPEPILCFDGDPAGLKAAARAAERVLPLLKPGYSLRFVFLPQGEDPDSLVRKNTEFQKLLLGAQSLLDTLWMLLTQGKTFDTPEKKTALQQQYTLWTQSIKHGDVGKNYLFAFKDLFYKKIIRKNEGNTHFSPLKRKNVNLLSIHEHLLLAILINHPNLLDETSDDLAFLEFKEARLHEMREAILQFYANNTSQEEPLKDFLLKGGFEDELERLLSPQVLLHGAFAKTSASFEEAREGWKEIFSRLERHSAKEDLRSARDSLANEMSPEAWQRFKMLKKSTMLHD
ncbi:MAG: DNA primase [Alphaproteobacteria bacterium]|nr:DNA primase [Alphaproteobacteria bacterium]